MMAKYPSPSLTEGRRNVILTGVDKDGKMSLALIKNDPVSLAYNVKPISQCPWPNVEKMWQNVPSLML
jgi:hypothetical protein